MEIVSNLAARVFLGGVCDVCFGVSLDLTQNSTNFLIFIYIVFYNIIIPVTMSNPN